MRIFAQGWFSTPVLHVKQSPQNVLAHLVHDTIAAQQPIRARCACVVGAN